MYRYTIPGIVKQGYLTKSPPLEKRGLKNWKKRWCVFTRANEEPCLNYYHSEESAFNNLPIKRVNLKECFKVEMDLIHSSHKNIFAMHLPERVYYFSAPSQTEMSEWADTMCCHLNLTRTDLTVSQRVMPVTPARERKFKHLTSSGDSSSAYAVRPLPKRPNSPLPPIPGDILSSLSPPTNLSTGLVRTRSPEYAPRHSLPTPDRNHGYPMRDLPPSPPLSIPAHSPSLPSRLFPHALSTSQSNITPPPVPSRHMLPDPHGKHPSPVDPMDHVSLRPPAPIPKAIPHINKHESFELADNPPTPSP